jgi:hypothetical protein
MSKSLDLTTAIKKANVQVRDAEVVNDGSVLPGAVVPMPLYPMFK